MKILWSPTAISDLVSIREYIGQDSPAAARTTAARIRDAVHRLRSFPQSGRRGRVPGTRELVIPQTSYIVVDTIRGEEVRIAAVLHGRQDWPESL